MIPQYTNRKKYQRNGSPVEVWKVKYRQNLFDVFILIQGTEKEMWDYMDSEMGHVGSYYALTDEEIRATELLDIPIYLAPEIRY